MNISRLSINEKITIVIMKKKKKKKTKRTETLYNSL